MFLGCIGDITFSQPCELPPEVSLVFVYGNDLLGLPVNTDPLRFRVGPKVNMVNSS